MAERPAAGGEIADRYQHPDLHKVHEREDVHGPFFCLYETPFSFLEPKTDTFTFSIRITAIFCFVRQLVGTCLGSRKKTMIVMITMITMIVSVTTVRKNH